ncbi:acyltransferase [Massilia sp. IC2-278]|uniref:acyltransferase family protein n=1 Tax=Massilia sp. IC2-278 TaxID=2887200 RepID=UPI001E3757D6|nr:acyltransferase [Massilia sp. IC2-278]MCC2961489.1 acyltransferase [Massilia sp. IC2-278]
MARTDFLDRIRVVLTALVILHHAAIMFGAPGGWYLTYPAHGVAEKLPFAMFVSVNQAFFMGFFFLLSGYFTALSYERKGAARFARDRLLRLGIPLLVYGFVLGPLTVALADMREGEPFLSNWTAMMAALRFEIGPLWFAWALLLFSAAYLLWRRLRGGTGLGNWEPGRRTLLLAALATGAAAFLLRLLVPVGEERLGLQVGYFASYTVLFAGGCAMAGSRWIERVGPQQAGRWSLAALLVAPLLFVYGIYISLVQGQPFETAGGWTLPALAYAFWEPFVAWGIILAMLTHFRRAEHSSPRWQPLARQAYAAYILHPPLLTAAGLLVAALPLPNMLQFALAGAVGVVASFLLARLALRLPGAARIL